MAIMRRGSKKWQTDQGDAPDISTALSENAKRQLAEYEEIVGPPTSWDEVKTRSTVIEQLYKNDAAALEVAHRRRQVVTAELQAERERVIADTFIECVRDIYEWAADNVKPHERAAFRTIAEQAKADFIAGFAERMRTAFERAGL